MITSNIIMCFLWQKQQQNIRFKIDYQPTPRNGIGSNLKDFLLLYNRAGFAYY